MQLKINLYVVLAYLVSVFGGYVVVLIAMYLIRKTTGQKQSAKWIDFWLGGTERAVVTTLVIVAPPYVAAFIGAWMALKVAANWQRRENTDEVRTATLIALIGSVFSFAIAIGCGVWANPEALRIWSTPIKG
jgi:uncharacterized membrane protein